VDTVRILCDVGGVLILSNDTGKRAMWEKKLGLQSGQLFEEVYKKSPALQATVGSVASQAVWSYIQDAFSLSDRDTAELIADFSSGDTINTEFYNYLLTLHKKYKISLLSNAWLDARTIYTKIFHLDRISDSMIISAEVGMEKPDRKIFLYACDLLQSTADEILFIDDTKENVDAAKKLGMKTVLFTSTAETITDIKQILSEASAASRNFQFPEKYL
jgi:putative hydrolase of the HAD superfamily